MKNSIIHHGKFIMNGKLYDTEKSQFLFTYMDENKKQRNMFVTAKGNFFSTRFEVVFHKSNCVVDYFDARPENEERVKEFMISDPEGYIRLFGEVEEA